MGVRRAMALACLVLWPLMAAAAQTVPSQAGIDAFVAAVERAAEAGDADALRGLARPDVRPALLSEFVQSMTFPRVTHATVKERDHTPLENGGVRLLLETLTDRDAEGRVTTWRVDLEPGGGEVPWRISTVERLSVIAGLFRLALDTTTEFAVKDLVVNAPDLTLSLPSGYAFVSRTPDGPTALVLVGRGTVDFAPALEAERGQVRIFSGSETLNTGFDAVFVRLPPHEFGARVGTQALTPRAVDPAHLRRALQTFDTYLPKSFQLGLNDLSAAQWSLIPSSNDFVAEIVTRRYGPLTYARANSEPEDISFFDRRRHRNISVYPSEQRLAGRGRFFSEDEKVDYDIVRYEIETSLAPDRQWIDGTAKLSIHTRAPYFSTLTLRLADSLVVRRVTSPQFGRLLHLRVLGQNNVLVGFPATVVADSDIDLVITYGGRLPPQSADREAVTVAQIQEDTMVIPLEPQLLYSSRSYWYPQSTVTDYASGKLSFTVPSEYEVIASGRLAGPAVPVEAAPGTRPRKRFVFDASKPTRYFAFVVSRFQYEPPALLKLRDDTDPLTLTMAANPRLAKRSRALGEKAADILKFYAGLMADAPYEAFTLALTESDLPGGHSPAYFAMLNLPLPQTPFVWNNDPVSFPNYPSFFIAHELAHQWWGQAVGWKNYHEQWLSEGFSQYFAAMFAEREGGPEQFGGVLRQMRRWAIELSPQGPVYLGYRLGHLKADGRVFRALVYNKGAMVLHMLRRLMGDEAFFTGLREFYASSRYAKAGTDDFRLAMEKAGGQPLGRFFERWVHGDRIPTVKFTSQVNGSQLDLRFEQKGEVFDIPITVVVAYADGTSEDVLVKLKDAVTTRSVPLKGAVRSIEVNRDGGSLAEIDK